MTWLGNIRKSRVNLKLSLKIFESYNFNIWLPFTNLKINPTYQWSWRRFSYEYGFGTMIRCENSNVNNLVHFSVVHLLLNGTWTKHPTVVILGRFGHMNPWFNLARFSSSCKEKNIHLMLYTLIITLWLTSPLNYVTIFLCKLNYIINQMPRCADVIIRYIT